MVVSEDRAELRKLIKHLESLEDRLSEHYSTLRKSVEQRDKFVLGATWGMIKGTAGFVAFIGGFYASDRFIEQVLGWHGIIAWTVSFIVGFVASFIIFCLVLAYLERQEEGDQRKLLRLPEWQRHDLND